MEKKKKPFYTKVQSNNTHRRNGRSKFTCLFCLTWFNYNFNDASSPSNRRIHWIGNSSFLPTNIKKITKHPTHTPEPTKYSKLILVSVLWLVPKQINDSIVMLLTPCTQWYPLMLSLAKWIRNYFLFLFSCIHLMDCKITVLSISLFFATSNI